MTQLIKITAFTNIGSNIAYTTLVPVVNMSGTPETQKANLQIVGNLILQGAGGSYFAPAAQAVLAQTVTNAAQPNITSVGTLTSLTVSGNVSAANANLGNLAVANFFSGDGGFLSNVYSDSNVANYLPNYAGTLSADNVIVSTTVKITPVTVSALPSAAAVGAGSRAFVTDADSTTFNAAAVGGGSNNMPVFSNGTNWFIG